MPKQHRPHIEYGESVDEILDPIFIALDQIIDQKIEAARANNPREVLLAYAQKINRPITRAEALVVLRAIDLTISERRVVRIYTTLPKSSRVLGAPPKKSRT
jgi:hypothetical protein